MGCMPLPTLDCAVCGSVSPAARHPLEASRDSFLHQSTNDLVGWSSLRLKNRSATEKISSDDVWLVNCHANLGTSLVKSTHQRRIWLYNVREAHPLFLLGHADNELLLTVRSSQSNDESPCVRMHLLGECEFDVRVTSETRERWCLLWFKNFRWSMISTMQKSTEKHRWPDC